MKTCHCLLLFALVALAKAADDDQTDQQEYCADSEVCEGLIGELTCHVLDAGIFCPLTCKKGCGAPAGSARKREMSALEEYKRKKIKAAQEFQIDCRKDDTMCCNAADICTMLGDDGPGRELCKHSPEYCCKACMDSYGQKHEWKKNQLLSLLERILQK